MNISSLSASDKARLRSLAQTTEPALKIGKQGLSPTVILEFERLLKAHKLVKVRFLEANRQQREAMTTTLLEKTPCHFINSIGSTAVFFRQEHSEVEQGE